MKPLNKSVKSPLDALTLSRHERHKLVMEGQRIEKMFRRRYRYRIQNILKGRKYSTSLGTFV